MTRGVLMEVNTKDFRLLKMKHLIKLAVIFHKKRANWDKMVDVLFSTSLIILQNGYNDNVAKRMLRDRVLTSSGRTFNTQEKKEIEKSVFRAVVNCRKELGIRSRMNMSGF